MNIIRLNEFGTNLGTRKLGIEVSEYIDFDSVDNLILDFEDVFVVTSSFADELIGKNSQKLGLDNFMKKVKIVNATKDIKVILKKAILDRLLELA